MQESFFDRAKLHLDPAKLDDEPKYKQPEFDGDGELVYSVEECHFLVNEVVSRLGRIRVRGEIIEVNPRGGATYFKLRDAGGKDFIISCIIFQWQAQKFLHLLGVGLEIVVGGKAELYKTGTFNLKIDEIKPSGQGAWKKEFEALKKRLQAKGYFDEAAKRPIPAFVQKIGLITSESGKAIHDFRKNLGDYGFQVFLYDVWVEGEKAEKSIVGAFEWFSKNRLDMDVLVLIRGGGSPESLVVFHSEKITDAMRASRIPVITGIGHEKDESIADYVADKRLSTPTAAAVFLRTQREELMRYADSLFKNIAAGTEELIENRRSLLDSLHGNLVVVFQRVVQTQKFLVSREAERLHRSFGRVFEGFSNLQQRLMHLFTIRESELQFYAHRIEQGAYGSQRAFEARLFDTRNILNKVHAILSSLNPEQILKRGYSVVYTKEKKVLKDVKDIEVGESVGVRVYKGGFVSRVEKIGKPV